MLLMFVFWPSVSFCQVNIEKLRGEAWHRGLSGNLGADLSFRSGNVDIWEIGGSARIDYGWEKIRTFAIGNGELGWESGNRFSNAGLLHWRGIVRRSKHVRPEGFVQINYDKARRIDFRGLVGGGIRLGLVIHGTAQIWWGTAYMLEYEDLDLLPGDAHPNRTGHHRWSNYVSGKMGKRVAVGGALYMQPRINAFGDYRVLGEFRTSVELSGRSDLVMTLNVRYDSKPPLGVEGRDIKLKTGLSIQL